MSADEPPTEFGRVTARQPFAYATSWPIEELTLAGSEQTEPRVLLKRYQGHPGGKPELVLDRDRERAVYRVLGAEGPRHARCLGSGPGWIALELLDGTPLWQHGDLEPWCRTARWAAELHARFAADPPRDPHLIVRDARFHRMWLERALRFEGDAVRPLAETAERAIARLASLPVTLLHGELYPSNVIVLDDGVAAVDWEMAAVGPGVIDLAALSTGWDDPATDSLCAAYGSVDGGEVACARLVLALQWLGWSRSWEAPEANRRDWLAEATTAAQYVP